MSLLVLVGDKIIVKVAVYMIGKCSGNFTSEMTSANIQRKL